MATFIITADSKPVYDSFGWSDYWNCQDWMKWHQLLVAKYGDKKADEIWANAWLAGVSKWGGGYGTAEGTTVVNDGVPVECRSTNAIFKAYVNQRPVLKAAVFVGVGGFIGGLVSNGLSAVSSAGELVGDAGQGITKLAKMLRWVIPVVAVTALAYVGYRIYSVAKS